VLQRHPDRLGDRVVADLPGRARPGFVAQAVHPVLGEPPAPLADRVLAQVEPPGDRRIGQAIHGQKDDPSPSRQRLARRLRPHQRLQLCALVRRKGDLDRPAIRHADPPSRSAFL
jgi:hypothetical protein